MLLIFVIFRLFHAFIDTILMLRGCCRYAVSDVYFDADTMLLAAPYVADAHVLAPFVRNMSFTADMFAAFFFCYARYFRHALADAFSGV